VHFFHAVTQSPVGNEKRRRHAAQQFGVAVEDATTEEAVLHQVAPYVGHPSMLTQIDVCVGYVYCFLLFTSRTPPPHHPTPSPPHSFQKADESTPIIPHITLGSPGSINDRGSGIYRRRQRSWLSRWIESAGLRGSVLLAGKEKKPVVISTVDPKTFFSNERTFLAWLEKTILIAGMAIGVLTVAPKSSTSRLMGFIMLPISILFVVYSLGQYVRRASMIRRRQGVGVAFEDRFAVGVMALIVFLGLVGTWIVKVYEMIA
jgi:uncharacterized membrane protein YidH (DUF202 family)